MTSAALLALINAVQIPLNILGDLNLSGPLYPPERKVANNSCYDYVVIGGGTAGCGVAARLSENPKTTVLLLEVGENPPALNFLPFAFPFFAGSSYDYNYTSTFDSYAASSQYDYTKLSAGRVLGGSSSINHFINIRGSKEGFNDWAKITGDPSWRYENVLHYFKKKEDLVDKKIKNSKYRQLHGFHGPNAITREPKKYADKYLKALKETGSRTPLDLTGNVSLGYAQSLFSVNLKGIRQNTAYTYLSPAKSRANLYVLRKTCAIRIIFKEKRAVAVVAVRNGKVHVFRASKEIILCAGVFNSPKILMLSGIGPKKHLKSFNISVIADLPVGNNFQDQVATSLVHRMESYVLPPPLYSAIPNNVPFPVIGGLATLNRNQLSADYQLFMLLFFADTVFLELACAVVFQFRADLCDKFNTANLLYNTLYSLLTITQPSSRGRVRLRSTNPFDNPLITTGYFQNKTDLNNMADYIIDYLKIENSTYFKEVNAKLVDPDLEACKSYSFRTREYWKCYALNTGGSVYHNGGTCSMASVVDSKLRVYKVKNLRVADASIMPILPSGSPYESVLMIAEKASDMIKADADKEATCSKIYVHCAKRQNQRRQFQKCGVKYCHESTK